MKRPSHLIIFALCLVIVYQAMSIHQLEHEKTVYNWKYFTAKMLLDDPVTRRIMCSK